ncbi:MAG: M48 family metalloprotease [Woeseiaceae bacterium]|nr:M48 family metalloprotease [Woeseiaceae bacterium]
MRWHSLILPITAGLVAGCSVNPVTGDRDFMLVSSEQELAMGEQSYVPMQQSQGGVYDVDPILTEYVSNVGMKVANESGVDLPYEFVVLNNSVPNAWALPGGKIAINRGLLTEMNSEAELAAVLGHEVTHAAARHSAQQQSRGMLTQGLVVATTIAASDSGYGDLAAVGAGLAGQLTLMKYGRDAELESDKYGMRYMSKAGYDPQGAVTLQETFVRLSEGQKQDWLSGLFASHPPSQERVDANRRRLKNLPEGGIIGEDRYAAAMRTTREVLPAYKAYDDGRAALGKKDPVAALALANEALTLFPDEAHFHALRGDVRLMNEQYDMAVTNYNRAIGRRDDFFYYYLQRGLAQHRLDRDDAALTDLERSLEYLPTAPAHLVLGDIKAERGATSEAIDHYKVVAKGGGDVGKAAYERLVYLELEQQPAAYVASACGVDDNGQVALQVRNDTPVEVIDVQVRFAYVDAAGAQQQRTQTFSGALEPGKIVTTRTGLTAYPSTRCEATVSRARPADAPSRP